MDSPAQGSSSLIGDSEDEFDWEEVQVPQAQHLEITLKARPTQTTPNKKKGISHAERLVRIDCHKIHTVCLVANASIRNRWINDPLLHARLLSLTPLSLQNAFATIHKSKVPDQNQRGRLFEAAVTRLTEWWTDSFFEVNYEGHIRSRTFDEVQEGLASRGVVVSQGPDAGSALDLVSIRVILDDDEGETIRTSKSLMKHALMQTGSRDVSAQLFTALCRALGIPTRLVVSLQSVPWQTGVGKPKPKYDKKPKGKGKARQDSEDMEVDPPDSPTPSVPGFDPKGKGKAKAFVGQGQRLDGGEMIEKSEKAKGKEKAKPKPIVHLRKTKSKGNVLGNGTPTTSTSRDGSMIRSQRLESPDPTTTPPVFWTEVFSRPDAKWFPVDPIRGIVNKRRVFDPTPIANTASSSAQPGSAIYPHPYAQVQIQGKKTQRRVKEENRMLYVLAFEEDGYARDVTRRYAREYGAKVEKAQGGSSTFGGSGGRGRRDWWGKVLGTVTRPYRLHRDDVEDEELESNQMTEGMPTTISGFKDHPLYVLTRHLKQTQTIHPPPPITPELGKFRGEPVYPRSSVVDLKTAENWMRKEGRVIKAGCQAMKFIKARIGTIGKMREIEVLREERRDREEDSAGAGTSREGGAEELLQGLYARSQTEPYVPDPVINGKVPKNNFGNIDLYVPSMLPQGAVHVPFKGVAKIARKLGLDHAEAVTGFDFKKRRAFPVIEGVVIAAENETVLLEAYWEAEQEAEEKAKTKREERVIKRWTRLVHGLRIRKRLQEQYANKPEYEGQSNGNGTKVNPDGAKVLKVDAPQDLTQDGAGFILGADDVVEAFHLPHYQYQDIVAGIPATVAALPPTTTTEKDGREDLDQEARMPYSLETMDVDSDAEMEEEVIPDFRESATFAPKTMRELAEDAARERGVVKAGNSTAGDEEFDNYRPSTPPLPGTNNRTTIKIPATSKVIVENGRKQEKAQPTSARPTPRRKRARSDQNETNPSQESDSSPTKRTRTKPAVVIPTTTRVLRSRVPKSQAQIQEEKELELAFKRAVAE